MIEPAVSIDRILLAFLVDAYDEEVVAERERTVLRLHPRVAPVKAAILPLIGKNDDMVAKARALYEELAQATTCVEYDDGGAIGRRYRRQDEIGTPFAFTIDDQTLEDDTVTVRDRDSLAQERLPLAGVRAWLDDALERPWKTPKETLGAAQRPQPEAAVVLVRRGDDGERFARGALGRGRASPRLGERAREQRLDPDDPCRRERRARRRAAAADRAARLRRVADERHVVGAALGAARQVRQVAGEPEQLELERERERVERRPRRARGSSSSSDVEEARQRRERALVPLLLGEEAQHRLGADQPDAEPVRLLAHGRGASGRARRP